MSCLQVIWDNLNFMLRYMQDEHWYGRRMFEGPSLLLPLCTRYIDWTMSPGSSLSLLDNPVEVDAWMRSFCQCAVSCSPYKANVSAEGRASEHLRRWMHLSKLQGIEALVWVRMEKSRCSAKAFGRTLIWISQENELASFQPSLVLDRQEI